MSHSTIAVLGEALVDEFHDGPVAGGAPFNVARSLAALGAPVLFIGRIGAADANAQRVLESAARYGLGIDGIQRDPLHATGRVSVHEGPQGHRFEIHADAAWDHLELTPALHTLAAHAPALLYFGSLAQRSPGSRATMRALLKPSRATRLLDLNLRPGTDDPVFAAESLMLADWLKVNDEELARLAAWYCPGALGVAAQVSGLMARFALQQLALTRGPDGWAWFGPGGVLQAEGAGVPQPHLVDTVGAGDSFTAMLLAGQALGRRLPNTLALANRYAAFICGVRGPLPAEASALAPWRMALADLPAA